MMNSVIKTNEKEITEIIKKHKRQIDPCNYMTFNEFIEGLEAEIRAYRLSLKLIDKLKIKLSSQYSLEDDAYWYLKARLEKREAKQMKKISELKEDLQILRGKNNAKNNPGINQPTIE